MELIRGHDPRYDEERAVFNASIDRHPAVIAKCGSPGDVAAALDLSRRDGLAVAVRAGGHSVAGFSVNDGGLVIDVRPLKAIEVEPGARTVRCGAGVTWGELDRATQVHGLATTGGRASTTGVAGFTLGGGSGWLERRFGLACDNLVSVDLVTADGNEVTASASSHPELFWALHGGGGNFGVATAFELTLHPVGPEVLAGLLVWSGEASHEVARAYRDLAADAPDALGSGLILLTAPAEDPIPAHLHGRTVVAVAVLWSGDLAEGDEVLAPLRALRPDADLVGATPYAEFQASLDDPPGLHHHWTADHHDAFPDAALDTFVRYGEDRPSPLSQQILLPWGGAIARVADEATPITHREVRWLTHPFAMWTSPAEADANVAWARAFRRDIADHTSGGAYLNFLGAEGEERIRAAYGPAKYRRLQEIKSAWDPANTFAGNQNIRPLQAAEV